MDTEIQYKVRKRDHKDVSQYVPMSFEGKRKSPISQQGLHEKSACSVTTVHFGFSPLNQITSVTTAAALILSEGSKEAAL